MPVKNYPFNPLKLGLYNKVPVQSVPEGAAYDALNWMTNSGGIELRRGYQILGAELIQQGRISGLGVGIRSDGYQIPFRTREMKAEYYDATSDTWIEIGSNMLGSAANGEDVSIEPFQSIAGGQIWLNSPNSGPKKIMIANPGSYHDYFDPTVNYKALIRIKQNRMFAFNITNNPATSRDINNIRLSQLETRGLTDYQSVQAEAYGTTNGTSKTFTHTLAQTTALSVKIGLFTQVTSESLATGDGNTKTFVGVLAIKSGHPNANFLNVNITCVSSGEVLTDQGNGTLKSTIGGTGTIDYVSGAYSATFNTAPGNSTAVTGAYQWYDTLLTEIFNDNGLGTLTGTLGGTGTINYTTGAASITFNTIPTTGQSITATYRYDNSNLFISKFAQPAATNYVSGNPNFFPQTEGGAFQNLFSLNEVEYCAHTKKFYKLTLTNNEVNATNYLYRNHVGIPYFRAGIETQDGIYCIDVSDLNDPKFVLIKISAGSTEVIPQWISKQLDLSNFVFSSCAAFSFNDYILFSCRTPDSPVNNRTFVYNWRYKTFDLLDYYASCFENYNGSLLAGDSLSDNVQTLFSGFDDDGNVITNYWKSGVHKLGFLNARGKKYPIRAQKKVHRLAIEGLIASGQTYRLYISLDRGPFVEIRDTKDKLTNTGTTVANLGAFIKGSGAYVDKTNPIAIGTTLIGEKSVGANAPKVTTYGSALVDVYHYARILPFSFDKFVDCQIMVQAIDVGYVSITALDFRDVRVKQDKLARKYRVI